MPCDVSHHSYLLLHFVTICDLCSYDFFFVWGSVYCRLPRRQKPKYSMRNCVASPSCRHGTNTPIQIVFFSSIWKLNTNGFFVNFVHCSGTADSCLCLYYFWAIYCLAWRFCIHARGKISGKGRSSQRTEQIMRKEWRAPYALRRLP